MGFVKSAWNDVTGKTAAKNASKAQQQAADQSIAEQQRQFNAMVALSQPYVDAGLQGLGAYQNLIGANGAPAQQAAVDGIQNTPLMQSIFKQGENAILQNAAATGGLRGGNVQSSLADNRMNALAQAVQAQMQNYGNLATLGQNAAAGAGANGMMYANNVSNLLADKGQAQAGYNLAKGQINAGLLNFGLGAGMRALGGLF